MNERLEQEWKSYCDKQGTGTMISVNVKDVAQHFYNLALEDVKKEVEKRKAVNEHFNLDEMEVKKIEWIDSCASNSQWTLMEEIEGEIEPIKIVSYGVLVQETKECITIAQNYGLNPLQCCSLMTIPKGCIKKITNIETIK